MVRDLCGVAGEFLGGVAAKPHEAAAEEAADRLEVGREAIDWVAASVIAARRGW